MLPCVVVQADTGGSGRWVCSVGGGKQLPIGVCGGSFEQIAKRNPSIEQSHELLLFVFVGITKANDASEALEGFAGREGAFGGGSGAFEEVNACEGGGDLFAGSVPVAVEGSSVCIQRQGILWVGSESHDLVAEDLCVGWRVESCGGFT